jgi:hypothetical protein
MKKIGLLIIAILLSMAVVHPAQARLYVGDPAPDFTLPGVGGTTYSLSDFEGDVVVLNFWTSW